MRRSLVQAPSVRCYLPAGATYEGVLGTLAIQNRIGVVDVHEDLARTGDRTQQCDGAILSADGEVPDLPGEGGIRVGAVQLVVTPEGAVDEDGVA